MEEMEFVKKKFFTEFVKLKQISQDPVLLQESSIWLFYSTTLETFRPWSTRSCPGFE